MFPHGDPTSASSALSKPRESRYCFCWHVFTSRDNRRDFSLAWVAPPNPSGLDSHCWLRDQQLILSQRCWHESWPAGLCKQNPAKSSPKVPLLSSAGGTWELEAELSPGERGTQMLEWEHQTLAEWLKSGYCLEISLQSGETERDSVKRIFWGWGIASGRDQRYLWAQPFPI